MYITWDYDRLYIRYCFSAESFTLAAAAIMDASTSFGPSVATRRNSEVPRAGTKKKGKAAKRAYTFSKKEIDSTPKMVSKVDQPYLER